MNNTIKPLPNGDFEVLTLSAAERGEKPAAPQRYCSTCRHLAVYRLNAVNMGRDYWCGHPDVVSPMDGREQQNMRIRVRVGGEPVMRCGDTGHDLWAPKAA